MKNGRFFGKNSKCNKKYRSCPNVHFRSLEPFQFVLCKTRLEKIISSREIRFLSGENGHPAKFCEGYTMAKWLKMTDVVAELKFNQTSAFLWQALIESNF